MKKYNINDILNKNDNDLTFDERLFILNYNIDNSFIETLLSSLLINNSTNKIDINNYVYNDSEIFNNFDNDSDTLFNKINLCNTTYGKYIFINTLKNPIKDINILKKRQSAIKSIQNLQLDNHLNIIKNIENDVLWFWNDEKNNQINLLNDIIYFNFSNPFININDILNNNEILLSTSNIYKIIVQPVLNIITPIMTFLIPIIIFYYLQRKFDKNTSFIKLIYNSFKNMFLIEKLTRDNPKIFYTSIITKALYLLLFFQNIHSSINISKNTNNLINIIHDKLNSMKLFIDNVDYIYSLTNDIEYTSFNNINIYEHIINFKNLFNTYVFTIKPKLLTNKGKILKVFKVFNKLKEHTIHLMNYIGTIDMIYGISKLLNYNFTLSIYLNNKLKPSIIFKDIWHPYLDYNTTIKNSVIIKNNMLITGPNAGGKSTFIKSIIINIILSQTICISSATTFKLTPFSMLETYLHIPDIKGKLSLFEAEMFRSKNYIDKLNNYNEFSLIILDEIFSSTNYNEGFSGAYAVLKTLSKFKNALFIATTHYTKLNILEKNTKGKIKNYKFNVDINNDIIKFNYKLLRGYSEQYIALLLLEKNNFDKNLINIAKNMSKKILQNIV